MPIFRRWHRCPANVDMYGRWVVCERYRGHPGVHVSLMGNYNQVQWPEGWQWEPMDDQTFLDGLPESADFHP